MKTPTPNPLKGLLGYGQSVWLDFIRRSLITSGELKRLIQEDGLRGVTSNPAIFEKAIAGSTDYKDLLSAASSQKLSCAVRDTAKNASWDWGTPISTPLSRKALVLGARGEWHRHSDRTEFHLPDSGGDPVGPSAGWIIPPRPL